MPLSCLLPREIPVCVYYVLLLLIGPGVLLAGDSTIAKSDADSHFFWGGILMFWSGAALFLIGILGLIALRNYSIFLRCLVNILLFLIMALALAIAVSTLISHHMTVDTTLYEHFLAARHGVTESLNVVEPVQRGVKCCGVSDHCFWVIGLHMIPASCCGLEVGSCDESEAYSQGCIDGINFAKFELVLSLLFLAVIALVGLIFTCFFFN